ncbi:MAG: hypothetical protein ACI959_000381 [Limisphaerales bacterium]|jgi:hypothetical protein
MEKRRGTTPDLLLYCAGVSREILDKCPESEIRKYRLLGLAVLVPALMGVFSGGYAVYTTFQSVPAALAIGLLWGFVILTIDRVLILTYRNKGTAAQNLMNSGLWLRLGLAALIAITISKPIEMRLFKDTIDEQITKRTDLRVEEEKKPFTARIDSINGGLLAASAQLTKDQEGLDRLLQKQRTKVERMQSTFMAEMDGSGGTMNRGIGPIAAQKRVQLERSEEELWYLEDQTGKRRTQLQEDHNLLASARQNEIRALQRRSDNRAEAIQDAAATDLLSRLTALSELAKEKPTVKYAGMLITLLFLFIELIPLLTKAFMRNGAYAFYLENEYQLFEQQSNMENTLDVQALKEAEQFSARKKSDEHVLGLRLDLLEKQVNHTSSYLELERRFEEMVRTREAELEGMPGSDEFKTSLARLKKEFFALSKLARPGIPDNNDNTVIENKDFVLRTEEGKQEEVQASDTKISAPSVEEQSF